MKRLVLPLVLMAFVGCASMGQVVTEKEGGGGTTRTYPVSFDDAWNISMTAFRWEGAGRIEEHKAEGYMLTESGLNLLIGTYGTFMGAWLTPLAPTETRVTVVTKRKVKTNVVTTLTEGTYHSRFGEAVEIIKSGKPLPASPP